MDNSKITSRLRSFGRLASHMSHKDKQELDARLAPVRCAVPEKGNIYISMIRKKKEIGSNR